LPGLKAKIIAAVEKARIAVDDLKISTTHVRRVATHVPGAAPTVAETLTPNVSVLFTRYDAKEIDGDRVLSSDWRGLVFPLTALPDIRVSDQIRVAATTGDVIAGSYRVMYNEKVMAGDKVVLHQVQLRL
jgi:hypothetical protein